MIKAFNKSACSICVHKQLDNNSFSEKAGTDSNTHPVCPNIQCPSSCPCRIFLTGRQIELLFRIPIGEVSIIVINQEGVAVSSEICNSEFEPSICLLKPNVKGIYRIYIIGSSGYKGEGEFIIK